MPTARRFVRIVTEATTIEPGELAIILAPDGLVSCSAHGRVVDLDAGSVAVFDVSTSTAVQPTADARFIGAVCDAVALGKLLDFGLGDVPPGQALRVIASALEAGQAGRAEHVLLELPATVVENIISLLAKIDAANRPNTAWEALHSLSCIVRVIGPALFRSLPEMSSAAHAVHRDAHLVARAEAILAAEFHRALTVPEVAARLNVSASTLNRAFNRERGGSVKDRLAAIRLSEFEALVRADSVSVAEAAKRVGFRSTSQIREKFREVHGMSVSAWRTRELQQPERASEAA